MQQPVLRDLEGVAEEPVLEQVVEVVEVAGWRWRRYYIRRNRLRYRYPAKPRLQLECDSADVESLACVGKHNIVVNASYLFAIGRIREQIRLLQGHVELIERQELVQASWSGHLANRTSADQASARTNRSSKLSCQPQRQRTGRTGNLRQGHVAAFEA